ncbi:Flp pilus assembly protein TadB [Cryobacterium sp. CAN_C3]|nr:Flp pilus assembly protein TadB [Cryobacterium sp. CAN_C3]
MSSLIQRRMELDRQRGRALTQIIIAFFSASLGVSIIVGNYLPIWITLLRLGVCLVGIVGGVRLLLAARRDRRHFEAVNGADAGKQS